MLTISLVGCGSVSDVPVGDAAENIRKLTLGYVQYASAHGGVGPADQKSLADFVVKEHGLTHAEAEAAFVSIRDQKPYVIRWAKRPMGSAVSESGSPIPEIIIYESEGADGTRYVADGRMSIKEMSAERFAEVVPQE